MTWTRICAAADLPEGAARVFDAGGVSLAVARSGTAVFALENRCSHDDGPLGEGRFATSDAPAASFECPRHGARFDAASGRAVRMPAIAPIRSYAARIDGDDVVVDLPEDSE